MPRRQTAPGTSRRHRAYDYLRLGTADTEDATVLSRRCRRRLKGAAESGAGGSLLMREQQFSLIDSYHAQSMVQKRSGSRPIARIDVVERSRLYVIRIVVIYEGAVEIE